MAKATTPIGVDMPLVDVPSSFPGFKFEEYADDLAMRLLTVDPAQLTLGILGGYGTGKTTMLKAILKSVQKPRKVEKKETVHCIWFEAWRYEHEDNLFLPLLATLLRNTKLMTAAYDLSEQRSLTPAVSPSLL